MSLKKEIQRKKYGGDIPSYILEVAETIFNDRFDSLERDIYMKLNKFLSQKEQEFKSRDAFLRSKIFKGDKGDPGYTPRLGVDFFQPRDGEPGKDAVLNEDKINRTIVKLITKLLPKKEEVKELMQDTPDQIVEKINKSTKTIPTSKISGFNDVIETLKNAIRGITKQKGVSIGGGGMGLWTHEQFSTSSATTAVTLANRVAGSGTALLVRYMGQLLAHNVQYTISGKVVTFTFTLDDSSFVDVSYVRA